MGGAWESLIKSVKSALAIALRNKTLSEEVLRTVLVEVEHSVNSRPLTHISPHSHEKEALTPNNFLFGSSSGQIQFPKFDQSCKCNREDYELSQKYSDLFWYTWCLVSASCRAYCASQRGHEVLPYPEKHRTTTNSITLSEFFIY